MELLVKYFVSILVLYMVQAVDANVYSEVKLSLRTLSRSYDMLLGKQISIKQGLQDIKNNASSLAVHTRIAVARSLNAITLAASSIANTSQACAETQVNRKAGIVNGSNEDIKNALNSLDQLKSIENELDTIRIRLEENSVQTNIKQLLKCKENVSVSSSSVANVTNCYRQVQNNFTDFITRENSTINAQYSSLIGAMQRINLLPVFNNIVMKAVVKTKSEVQDILLLCKKSNQTMQVDVGAEIKKLEAENQNRINSKINKILDLLDIINSRAANISAKPEDIVDAYFVPLVVLLNSTLQLLPNYTDVLSRDKLVPPEVEAAILKNITATVKAVLVNDVIKNISNEVSATINNLEGNVSENYVKSKCQNNTEAESYNSCVKSVLAELEGVIKNADNILDNVYNQSVKLNESLSAAIFLNLKTSSAQAVNIFTQTLGSHLNAVNAAWANIYNKTDNTLETLDKDTANLINSTFNNFKSAVELAQKLNLSIKFEQVYPNMETLKQKIKNNLIEIVGNATKVVTDLETKFPITIDPSEIYSDFKNCSSQYKFEHVFTNCIKPIITDFNNELKTVLTTVSSSSQSVVNVLTHFEKDLNLLVKDFSITAYEIIKSASTDANIPTVVVLLENNVLSKRDNIQEVLDKIRTELNNVKQMTLDSIKDVQNRIDNALASLTLAINVTSTVNPKANLTQQKALLEKLRVDAKSKTNLSISEIISQTSHLIEDLTKQYLSLNNDYSSKISELNVTVINNRCKNQSGNTTAFISCVYNVIKEFSNDINNLSKKIDDLYDVVKTLTLSIDAKITSKVTDDLKPFSNAADPDSTEIFFTYNVTNQQIMHNALENIKLFNISNIQGIIDRLISLADEIDKRDKSTKSSANYTLNSSGVAINDIVGIGRNLCGPKSVDVLVKEKADLISVAIKSAFEVSPDSSAARSSLLLLAKYINDTLNYELSLLNEDNLSKSCPPSLADNGKLQLLHKCILIQVSIFSKYYNAESGLLRFYKNTGNNKYKNSLESLNKWSTEVVNQKVVEISNTAKQSAENYYNKCNVTVEKIINYSLSVAKNHNNNFQPRISTNVTAIDDLVTVIAGKNYSAFTADIRSRLQVVVDSVVTSIAAVLNSNNKSIITEEIGHAVDNLISDGVRSLATFIGNFSSMSLKAAQRAASLVQTREELQKNYNNSFLYTSCYSESSRFPLVDMSGCSNILAYKNIYQTANTNILNSLLVIKQNLQNLNNNYINLIAVQADYLVNEQEKSGYYLAYKIYKAAGLVVPKEVASVVDVNRCIQGTKLATSQFVCVIIA